MALSSQGALGFPAPGKTFPNARVSASVQGDIAEFPNMASTDTTNPADGRKTICRLVQNNSGGALNAGVRCVVAANGYQVSGAAGADVRFDGAVDPQVPSAGVADQEWFLLVVSGPTKLLSSEAIAAGNDLGGAASGKTEVRDADVAGLTGKVGKAEAAAAGADALFAADVSGVI